MKEYLEQMLHAKAELSEYSQSDLPLYLSSGYELYRLRVLETCCVIAKPKVKNNLAALRKHWAQLCRFTGAECAYWLIDASAYVQHKLIENGIPFVVQDRQVYLPFLGVVLANRAERAIPEVKAISFLTQKLLLMAVYEKWDQRTLTEAAQALCVSKMSVSRCFDELESLELKLIEKVGKSRCFIWHDDVQALWTHIRPALRDPVAKEYRLDEPLEPDKAILGGMSALSEYSMLNDNEYRTWVLTKELAKEYHLNELPRVPKGELPAEIIQVLQYDFPYGDGTAVDPLTAILSIPEEEKSDPRIDAGIDEVMEEIFYGKRA